MQSHPLLQSLIAAALTASLLPSAHAGPDLEARIQSIDSGSLTLLAAESVPPWLRKGQTVSALGWEAQVQAIVGQHVSLAIDTGKLKQAKVGDRVSIREPAASDDSQMCGS